MCSCNGGASSGKPAEEYVVTKSNGQSQTFSSEPEARIYATMNNGTITVKKK